MLDTRVRSAMEIETQLLTPGSRYLLASFAQPSLDREQDLLEVGLWFGLEEALASADLAVPASDGATGSWLAALEWAEAQVGSDASARELRALTKALRQLSRDADKAGKEVALEGLWTHMSSALRTSLGLTPEAADGEKTPHGRATKPATLRGRRWGELRPQLANALQRLAAPRADLLPRGPRAMSTFDDEHYRAVRDALHDPGSGGLAVIAAPPGSGKCELALRYARHFKEDYDNVFFVRASDRFQLEQDFLEMARLLVGETGDRGFLRREAFRVLESRSRWLMIFASVRDPAWLLPYLPWNPEGHKLCTYWADSEEMDDSWLMHLNTRIARPRAPDGDGVAADPDGRTIANGADRPGLLEPMKPEDALAFVSRELDELDADRSELEALSALVAPSRLAAVLAVRWLAYSKESVAGYLARRRELDGKWERYAAVRGEHREPPPPRTPDYQCGLRAALMTLEGLADDRWHVASDDDDAGPPELGAVALLGVLETYGAGNFPADVLDDTHWKAGRSGLDDRRLAMLHDLGLVDRSDGLPYFSDFALNPIVREAVRHGEVHERSLGIATRTLLFLMGSPANGRRARTQLDLLPQAERLALRVAPSKTAPSDVGYTHDDARDVRPLAAVELHARAAACHLGLQRNRVATEQLARMDVVLTEYRSEIGEALSRPEMDWSGLPEAPATYRFAAPLRRVCQLLRSLRTDGYPQVAHRLYIGLVAALPQSRERSYMADEASLFFEGALARRAVQDTRGGSGEEAEHAIMQALGRWRELGDEQGQAAARDLMAVLALDRGDLELAHHEAEKARETQERLLATVAAAEQDHAREELARSWSLLGRIRATEGRVREALELMRRSIETWQQVGANPATRSGLRINDVSARSQHALLAAVLGDVRSSEQKAFEALREADAIYPRGHRKKAMILSNTAQVLRMNGEITRAREMHQQALDMAERLWGSRHQATSEIRRSYAETLLASGRPHVAVVELLKVLEALGVGPTTGDAVARGRAWTVLGSALVETSVCVDREPARGDAALDLGRQAFEHARALFDRAAGDSEHRHPDAITCLLGRAEVALRLRDGAAVQLAELARDMTDSELAAGGSPEGASVVMVLPRACLIRARALTAEPSALAALESDAKALEQDASQPGGALTPASRLQVALASIAVSAAQLTASGSDIRAGEDLHASARGRMVAALKPLRERLREEPHQLVARSYAELALLADNFLTPRQRARDERERDRARPPFHIEEFRNDIVRWLVRSEEAAPRHDPGAADERRPSRRSA